MLEKAAQAVDDAERLAGMAVSVASAVGALADVLSTNRRGDGADVRAARQRLRLAVKRMRATLQNADAAVKASGLLKD